MKHQKTIRVSKKSLKSSNSLYELKKICKKIQKLRQNQISRTLNEVPKLKFSIFRASKQQKTRSPSINSNRS